MVGAQQIPKLLERGYRMATCRKRNLKAILDYQKKAGARLRNREVATLLWNKAEHAFKSFSAFEMEEIHHIRIEFVAHTNCIGMTVSVRGASTKYEIKVRRLDEVLLMSPDKMKSIDKIMGDVMEMAKHNGLKTHSYADKGVLAEDEVKYWVVKWTEQ